MVFVLVAVFLLLAAISIRVIRMRLVDGILSFLVLIGRMAIVLIFWLCFDLLDVLGLCLGHCIV